METIPCEQKLQISLNNVRVGLVRSCRERTLTAVKPVGARNRAEPNGMAPTARYYVITLQRIVPEGDGISTEGLHNFYLTVGTAQRMVQYAGCEFSSLTRRIEADGVYLEEAEIYAARRTVSAKGG